ncbi:hypothetical protein VTH06DRAFT_3780 [Thermothelomyces fergusii]
MWRESRSCRKAEIWSGVNVEAPDRARLAPTLQIPKNRSTGNLGAVADDDGAERPRIRFSFDAGAATAEYETMTRSSIVTDHDLGLGMSGLRRIRQQPNVLRTPTMPAAANRTLSLGDSTRSVSTSASLDHPVLLSSYPASPTFAEDLSRFPSESLHSFSFAHQSEEYIHNRQNVLKRSMEFMRDRMAWSVSSNAGIASAQARATGDVEAQTMLDLLSRAHLVGAGNLPNTDPNLPTGPLTGPAATSNTNDAPRLSGLFGAAARGRQGSGP